MSHAEPRPQKFKRSHEVKVLAENVFGGVDGGHPIKIRYMLGSARLGQARGQAESGRSPVLRKPRKNCAGWAKPLPDPGPTGDGPQNDPSNHMGVVPPMLGHPNMGGKGMIMEHGDWIRLNI